MFRGLYTAATGMNFQLNRQDAVANNLANLKTIGYKRDETIGSAFRERLMTAVDRLGTQPIGVFSPGVNLEEFYTDHTPGAFLATDNPLDLAIAGEGFFLVGTPGGERLTRNGSFARDRDGFLVTTEGERVMGRRGAIPLHGTEVTVLEDGTVKVDGNVVDRILVVSPSDPAAMEKEGYNRFLANGGWREETNYTIRQGMLEESNVNPVREMVTMIEVTRAYESNQKVISVFDEVMRRVANDLGRI